MELSESLKKLLGIVEKGAAAYGSATKPVDVARVVGSAVGDKVLDVTGSPAAATTADVATQWFADPTSLVPAAKIGGIAAVGLVKGQQIFRGVKKGTEEFAFLNPREAGSHVTTHKPTAEKFASSYKDNGEVLSWSSNVDKPFLLEEVSHTIWWPHNTAKNILEGGQSKLSAEARNNISQISDDWFKELGTLDNKRIPWEEYGKLKDELSATYNKKITSVLQKEGYDHISYPNTAREVAEGGHGAESSIIFDKKDVSKVGAGATAKAK